jgi:hypothetical protein
VKALAFLAAATLWFGVTLHAQQAPSAAIGGTWDFTAPFTPAPEPVDYSLAANRNSPRAACLKSGCRLELELRDKKVIGKLTTPQETWPFTGKWNKDKLEFALSTPLDCYRYSATLQPDGSLVGTLARISTPGISPGLAFPSASLGASSAAYFQGFRWSATRALAR